MTRSSSLQHHTSPSPTASVWERLGLAIGHATDVEGATGCTVIRGITDPFRCSAALIGQASGTRELATCSPDHLVDRTDAVFFTGGSAYGLDAAAGVMRWMEERGRGFAVGAGVVPIVPAAVIFDLSPLGRFDARPTAAMAHEACERAVSRDIAEGCVGAGTGALVGKAAGVDRAMKGGIGLGEAERHADTSATSHTDSPSLSRTVFAAAIAVVNAFGDVRDAHGEIIAGARAADGGFADSHMLLRTRTTPHAFAPPAAAQRRNTTLALVAVSVPLTKQQLADLAQAATAAFMRRVTPCGTAYDGDVLFTVAPISDGESPPVPNAQIEAVAIAALEQAIERGVLTAHGRDGIPGLADAPETVHRERTHD